MYEYAFMADIECMYMQVKIPTKYKNALRFFWDVNGKVNEYRMTSHLFGAILWPQVAPTRLDKLLKIFLALIRYNLPSIIICMLMTY